VLDKGQVIESGSHRELLDQDGEYAKLCKIQANFAKEVV
jgi:ABC-type multidrug transport system fused ATPase/permease subunit